MGAEGLIPTTTSFGTALGDIARCEDCGHMQLDPMPDELALAQGYATATSEDYAEEEVGQRATARAALERIERWTVSSGTVLDLGCWLGFLLAEARDRGWATLGVEPSEFASSYARERLGLDVITGELLSTPLQEASFHAVAMGDVVEHLPDPGKALAHIRALLAPRGVVWMALPDAGSRVARLMGSRWWSVIPTHVQYFTRSSMAVLLQRSGFEVLEFGTAPKAFTVRYYLGRIGGYSQLAANVAVRGAEAAGIAERLWAPDFRDRMFVIARPV